MNADNPFFKLEEAGPAPLDLTKIPIFKDGSTTTAADKEEENLLVIRKCEDVLKLLKLFVLAHRNTLAGLWWRVGYLDPEIEIGCGLYRGQKASAADIAKLWPDAAWERITPKWKHERDEGWKHWKAVVNGVTLLIKNADRAEVIVRGPPDGPIFCEGKGLVEAAG